MPGTREGSDHSRTLGCRWTQGHGGRRDSHFSVGSFVGQLPWNPSAKGQPSSPDALLRYSSAANRSRDEYGLLQPDWRGALSRWVAPLRPLFRNGNAVGVFVGDEMGCGGSRVSPSNMSSVLRALRALVGPGPLLYLNDCVHSEEGSSLLPKGGKPGQTYTVDLGKVPPELDLISMDCYSKPSYYNASMELAHTKACEYGLPLQRLALGHCLNQPGSDSVSLRVQTTPRISSRRCAPTRRYCWSRVRSAARISVWRSRTRS